MLSWTWLDGRCRAAMRQAAEQENRQGRLVIETEAGGDVIGVVLTAGLIARRITQWALPGALALGRRLAIIHFGSRSVMYLPEDRYELLLAEGDRVRAGLTPVARRLTGLSGNGTGHLLKKPAVVVISMLSRVSTWWPGDRPSAAGSSW
jgi:phosphatidylserine decarboxylase precursor-related protein